jgi:hypothetical protein
MRFLEEYSIEWFKEVARDNPEWLGEQARHLFIHYQNLEIKIAMLRQILRWALDEEEGWELRAFAALDDENLDIMIAMEPPAPEEKKP